MRLRVCVGAVGTGLHAGAGPELVDWLGVIRLLARLAVCVRGSCAARAVCVARLAGVRLVIPEGALRAARGAGVRSQIVGQPVRHAGLAVHFGAAVAAGAKRVAGQALSVLRIELDGALVDAGAGQQREGDLALAERAVVLRGPEALQAVHVAQVAGVRRGIPIEPVRASGGARIRWNEEDALTVHAGSALRRVRPEACRTDVAARLTRHALKIAPVFRRTDRHTRRGGKQEVAVDAARAFAGLDAKALGAERVAGRALVRREIGVGPRPAACRAFAGLFVKQVVLRAAGGAVRVACAEALRALRIAGRADQLLLRRAVVPEAVRAVGVARRGALQEIVVFLARRAILLRGTHAGQAVGVAAVAGLGCRVAVRAIRTELRAQKGRVVEHGGASGCVARVALRCSGAEALCAERVARHARVIACIAPVAGGRAMQVALVGSQVEESALAGLALARAAAGAGQALLAAVGADLYAVHGVRVSAVPATGRALVVVLQIDPWTAFYALIRCRPVALQA